MNLRKIVKSFIPKKLFRTIEPYGHWGEAILLNTLAGGSPARRMKVIGVTGTNGKTTTCFMIHRMLHEAGYKVGLMTTVAYGVGDNLTMPPDHYTNVPVPLMIKRLKKLHEQGAEWLVLETTSMALAQHRVWGVSFHLAVMTNISQDHLDYHGTMANYIKAKVKLFKLANKNKNGARTGVVNADDATADQFTSAVKNHLTYGIKNGDLQAKELKLNPTGITYEAKIADDNYHIKCNITGRFNVYNSLAAIGAGRALGLNRTEIEKGIAALEGVAGRLTSFTGKNGVSVTIDFAHTPDALENALKALKESSAGKVILVFGATGDRDKLKRPIMGRVAAKNADLIYLTDDETYTEDPKAIIEAVYKGIEEAGGGPKTTIVEERLEAIKAAIAKAKKGDTVLLAGIGHQTSRNMGGKEVAWNEIEIARKLIK